MKHRSNFISRTEYPLSSYKFDDEIALNKNLKQQKRRPVPMEGTLSRMSDGF